MRFPPSQAHEGDVPFGVTFPTRTSRVECPASDGTICAATVGHPPCDHEEVKGAPRRAAVIAAASAVLVVLGFCIAAFVIGPGPGPLPHSQTYWWAAELDALVLLIPAALIVIARPGLVIGWLFLLAAFFLQLSGFGRVYALHGLVTAPGSLPRASLGLWAAVRVSAASDVFPILILLLFPTGTWLARRRWRRLSWVALALVVWSVVGSVIIDRFVLPAGQAPKDTPRQFLTVRNFTHLPLPGYGRLHGLYIGSLGLAWILALLIGVAVLLARRSSTTGPDRKHLGWMAVATLVSVAAQPIPSQSIPGVLLPALAMLVWAVVVAVLVLKHQLYGIEMFVSRVLVLAASWGVLLGAYALVVFGVDQAVGHSLGLGGALAGAALVVVAFAPVRGRIQHVLDRRLYGDRADPVAALQSIGRAVDTMPAAEGALASIAETVKATFKLEDAHLTLAGDPGGPAEAGPRTEQLPLEFRGEQIGTFVYSPRRWDRLSRNETAALEQVVRFLAPAVHAAAVGRDLQRSREQLVTAREEERRRLRADLHDGLGPALAAVTMKLDASRNLLRAEPERADLLLAQVRGQVEDVVGDIRRLVYDLRPPALDDLGLVNALRQFAESCSAAVPGDGLSVSVQAPERVEVPAALEVATYRIVTEAVTNAIRHGAAVRCDVVLTLNGSLEVDVRDDGRGILPDTPAGVGVTSMRERAAELGGVCTVSSLVPHGTRVHARLPLPPEGVDRT